MYWEPLLYFLKYYLFWNEEILASFLRSQMTFEQFSWGENRVKKNREKFTSLRLKCLRHLSIIFYTSSSRLPSFSLSPPETWSSFCDTDSSRKSITYAAAAPWREARVAPFQSIYRLEEKQHRIQNSDDEESFGNLELFLILWKFSASLKSNTTQLWKRLKMQSGIQSPFCDIWHINQCSAVAHNFDGEWKLLRWIRLLEKWTIERWLAALVKVSKCVSCYCWLQKNYPS